VPLPKANESYIGSAKQVTSCRDATVPRPQLKRCVPSENRSRPDLWRQSGDRQRNNCSIAAAYSMRHSAKLFDRDNLRSPKQGFMAGYCQHQISPLSNLLALCSLKSHRFPPLGSSFLPKHNDTKQSHTEIVFNQHG
jgi:hypothetical protein